ncbi:MAG: hypothetical protein ACKOAO_04570 [Oxalobacteraceae bacterium]
MTVSITNLNLSEINNFASNRMTNMEGDVKTQLNTLQNGGELTQGDLLKLQFNIAKYTISASTISAITKEVSDSLKQTANKIG